MQTTTGQPTVTSYSDAFCRETRKAIVGFDGADVYADKEYDNYGHLKSSSSPYKASEMPLWTTSNYDEYDRPVTVNQPNGSATSYSYSGNEVTENKDGVITSKTTDATGKLVNTTDAGGTVAYTYRADGQPDNVNAAGVVTTFVYNDPYNRQTKLIDPSAGTIQTAYDDANHTVTQTWNSGKQITTVSNKFGQPTTKTTPDFTTTYSYDPTYGRPTGSTSTNGTSKNIDYDTNGRLWKSTETVSDKTYQEVYAYDQGRIASVTYNTNTGINTLSYPVVYKYNTYNYLSRLEDTSGNRLREVNSVNALGQETSVLLGNGLTTTKNYTPEGLWTNVTTSNNVQNMSFNFNRVNGTLNSRTDNVHGLSENFTYDGLYRLKSFGSKTTDYDTNGNILAKSDVGGYTYPDTSKPYTLSTVTTANVDLTSQLDVDYTVMSRPTSIRNTTGLSTTFTYNDDYDRAYMQVKQGTTETLSKYYFGSGKYEIETIGGIEKQRLYLDGSPYTASILLEKTGAAAIQTYYLHRDYLGSITQISNNSGNLAAEYSYDAWGRMRNPSNWQVYAQGIQPAMLFGARGYTGHEQMNQVGLINMNARLYDPLLARFLAPDPFVGSGMTNDFNRYVYAKNNPLMYTDPTGLLTWKDIFSGLEMIGGSILECVPGMQGLGTSLIVSGFSHFANTIDNVQTANYYGQSMSWNQASNQAGIEFSSTIGINNNSQNDMNYSNENYSKSDCYNLKDPGDSRFFQGTDFEAASFSILLQSIDNLEHPYYSTEKGFYFEPSQGYIFDGVNSSGENNFIFKRNYVDNMGSHASFYTETSGDGSYVYPYSVMNSTFVYYAAHPHPYDNIISQADLNFSDHHSYYNFYAIKPGMDITYAFKGMNYSTHYGYWDLYWRRLSLQTFDLRYNYLGR